MGFLDEAEVNLNDIPDDPYGFGNDYWPVYVKDVKKPEVTKNGQRFGMMVTWAIDHPSYQHMDSLGYGNWVQLPVPKALQGSVPWDPKSEEGKKCLFNLKSILSALGFGADEMGSVGPDEMMQRRCMAKIRVSQNPDNGFWQFNVYAFKAMPANGSGEGMNEFTSSGTSNPEGKSSKDLLEDELNNI